jgi:hypothetical protein
MLNVSHILNFALMLIIWPYKYSSRKIMITFIYRICFDYYNSVIDPFFMNTIKYKLCCQIARKSVKKYSMFILSAIIKLTAVKKNFFFYKIFIIEWIFGRINVFNIGTLIITLNKISPFATQIYSLPVLKKL